MVSKKYYYDIDLRGNRLLNFAVESVSGELPSEANEGAVIYHSGEGVMYQRLKDGWKVIASGKDLEDALSKVSEDLQALSKDTEDALDTKADKTTVSSLSYTLTEEIQDRVAGDNTNATAISNHVANKSNPHGVTKAQVGLGNVDNTSDVNKPISTAVQNALNEKASKSVVTQSANGLMSSADKKKLDGIASGAQVNVIETVKVNGTALTPSSKAVNIDLSDYAKKGDVTTVMRYKGSVATFSDLPTTPAPTLGDTYNVIDTNANYTWDGSAWDLIGSTVDLSGYATKTEVTNQITAEATARSSADTTLQTNIDGKVSKRGDIMTGELWVERNYAGMGLNRGTSGNSNFMFNATINGTNTTVARIRNITDATKNRIQIHMTKPDGSSLTELFSIVNEGGIFYATAPSPKKFGEDGVTPVLDKSDNSPRIATTEWVNQANFLVHTTGNETKSGILTLTDGWRVNNGTTMDVINTNIPKNAYPAATSQRFINFKDGGDIARSGLYGGSRTNDNHIGLRVFGSSNFSGIELAYYPNDNTYKAFAPNTPTDATSNEIATANWVNNKLAGKIHISADAPTASDGNDGDIWLQYE